jgi:predicted ATPase
MSDNFFIKRIFKRDDIEPYEDVYPYNIPLVKNFKEIEFHKPVTFFVGENGSGKSTLLEAFAILAGLNPEGGSRNFNFATRATHSDFHDKLKMTRSHIRNRDAYFYRAESFYNVATNIDDLAVQEYYGNVSLHAQSHGESFMTLLLDRLGGNGIYIFDEPESALSPMRQLTMLTRIHDLVKLNSQFLIATHSPIIMSYPDADVYDITDGRFDKISAEETMHYKITKHFLNNTNAMLSQIL